MPGMILLEPGNRILEECVASQICPEEKNTEIKVNLCDFDDVSYKITVDKDNMNLMRLSMGLPCFRQIDEFGGKAALAQYYGPYAAESEVGYNITLEVKLDEKKGDRDLVKSLSLIKSRVTGGVFDYFFDALAKGTPRTEKFKFDLRSDTTIYFVPRSDRVTVIFQLDFTEKVDQVIAKVFLNEFVASRKNIGRAPPTSFGANPPSELSEWGITENQGCLGYMSFAILPSHLEKGKKDTVIAVLQSFRTFLQYHIKCSKSHFHSKMRHRVRELLKVKNRAHVEIENKEKKTVGGKTFKRS